MALIQCRECGKDISDAAPGCPHCGAPRVAPAPVAAVGPRRGANPWMIIGWILLAAIVLPLATCMVMVGIGSSNLAEKRTSEAAAPANPVAAPSVLYNGYLTATERGSKATADEYARLLRTHYPYSPETKLLPAQER